MALRWIEGWENATTNFITHARLYATATGTAAQETSASEVSSSGNAISSDEALFIPPTFASLENSWIIGLAFRPEDTATISVTQPAYVAMGNAAGEQMRFEFIDANPATSKPGGFYYTIRAMRGATELATCTQKFPMGLLNDEVWIYFEFKMTIDNATGSFEGRFQYTHKGSINPGGAPVTMLWDAANTNVDTQEQGTVSADRFTLNMDTGNTGHEVATDDIYVCDSTGAKNNDYLGKVIIKGQKPSTVGGGDGDTVDWVLAGGAFDTHDAWDELKSGTEDDERVTSDASTEIHLCVVDPLITLTDPATTIVGVRLDTIQHMETTGDLDIAQMWRKTTATAGETASGTINVASTTYEGLATVLEDDPNTATDWDQADLDSYQYGVRNDG